MDQHSVSLFLNIFKKINLTCLLNSFIIEATSNLDSVNEKHILDAIEELHGEITIL
jgi:hypothetical protein